MENRRKNSRKNITMADVDTLVLKDHLLRKVEDVMDYAAVAVQKAQIVELINLRSRREFIFLKKPIKLRKRFWMVNIPAEDES